MAVTVTKLGTTRLADGTVRVRAVAVGDNAYPAAGYDLSTAAVLAALGLKQYTVKDDGSGFVDPIVTGVNQQGLLAEIVALKLLVSYPTGGGVASPVALAAPLVTVGAVAMTSAAANGAGDLTPGVGKACAVNTDLSGANVKFFFDAYGYAV